MLAFAGAYRPNNDPLFQNLRQISLSRDPGASIDLKPDEWAKFECRNDIRKLRAAVADVDKAEKAKNQGRLRTRLDRLQQLQLEVNRDEYFDRADHLQVSGFSTSDIRHAHGPAPPPGLEAGVVEFMVTSAASTNFDHNVHSRPYMHLLLGYVTRALVVIIPVQEAGTPDRKGGAADAPEGKSCCLLCSPSAPYSSRSALTRHFKEQHLPEGFGRPFACPEYHPEFVVHIAYEWSNHVETAHGKASASNLPLQHILSSPSCSICYGHASTQEGLLHHMNHHVRAGFRWPASYLTCAGLGRIDVMLADMWEWLDHVRTHHIRTLLFCLLCGYLCSTTSGLTRHGSSVHRQNFEQPFPCPDCQRQDNSKVYTIDGVAS